MPLPTFSARLQHGISGGFAPPTPSALHTIDFIPPVAAAAVADSHPVLQVSSHVRPDGTAELQPGLPKALVVPAESDEEKAIHELHAIIKELPMESPPGSQDIYGLDTSIAWASEGFEWYNGGPQGCGVGESFVKASETDKAKFRRAVAIITELVNKAK